MPTGAFSARERPKRSESHSSVRGSETELRHTERLESPRDSKRSHTSNSVRGELATNTRSDGALRQLREVTLAHLQDGTRLDEQRVDVVGLGGHDLAVDLHAAAVDVAPALARRA